MISTFTDDPRDRQMNTHTCMQTNILILGDMTKSFLNR